MKSIDLSIVIPAYKEEKRIGKTLDQLARYLKTSDYFKTKNTEVIVVSADSQDKTHKIIKSKQKLFNDFRLITPGPRLGKGRDVKMGMLASNGKAVLFMDADLATPLKYIESFYRSYLEGSKIIIATRDLRRYRSNFSRIIISAFGNILFRAAGGVWLQDSQCGFKMFSAEANQICFSRLKIMGWGFDMEVLAIAKANNLSIEAVRIHDWVNVAHGTFEDSLFKNTANSLLDLLTIFYRRLSGFYKSTSTSHPG
jgi:dolichyl-phosphate beta-glucosyltransferase